MLRPGRWRFEADLPGPVVAIVRGSIPRPYAIRVSPQRRPAVCEFLTAHFPATQRASAADWLRERFESGEFDPHWLMAVDTGTIKAATYLHVDGHGGAVMMGYRATNSQSESRLWAHASILLKDAGVSVLQAVTTPEKILNYRGLPKCGFQGPYRLIEQKKLFTESDAALDGQPFLPSLALQGGAGGGSAASTPDQLSQSINIHVSGLHESLASSTPPRKAREVSQNIPRQGKEIEVHSSIQLVPYTDDQFDHFADLLVRSYVDSQDMPELNDIRTPAQAMGCHLKHAHERSPHLYRILVNAEPVGVLFFNPAAPGKAWDLTYLGLLPECRKRGIGKQIVKAAIAIAAQNGAPALMLTFDERNEGARRLYESTGFRSCGSYDVYLRLFKS